MTSGVKLRKIDQLIEKFFYNGLRPTNAVQVEVKVTSQLEDGSENESESKMDGEKFSKIIQDDQKPSTSKVENVPGLSESEDSDGSKPNNLKVSKTSFSVKLLDVMDPNMYNNCPQSFNNGFLNPTTAAMIAAAHRGVDNHYGSIDNQRSADVGSHPQPPYVSAAAYAAAAGFGAFLNPQRSNTTMDTYPLTSHMSENSPSNAYVGGGYDYPYYQQYQAVQSPNSFQGNYILQTQQNSPVSVDGDDPQGALSHMPKTSPETLVWLSENYEPCEGSSLPRCTLYSHYRRHCAECGLDPVNPASFGKLIRSVFRGLKTRRLGTRGNSKYHYYGIRIKPNSPFISEIENERNGHHHPTHTRHQRRSDLPYATRSSTAAANSQITTRSASAATSNLSNHSPTVNSNRNGYESSPNAISGTNDGFVDDKTGQTESMEAYSELMARPNVPTITVPDFEDLEPFLITVDLEVSHVNHFVDIYIKRWVEAVHLAEQLQFKAIEELWCNFWSGEFKNLKLNQIQMFQIVSFGDVAKFLEEVDQLFYQALTDLLMPNVLNPVSNSKYAVLVRNFAKQVAPGLQKALQGAPIEFLGQKMASVRAFAHRLKRYTSIHHLAHAARSVLDQPKQIDQMYNDFCRIDVASIQEQAGWVCECDPILFHSIFNAFKENLKSMRNLESWAEWMEAVVDQALANYHDKPLEIQAEKSKNLVLIWSYFGSAIIRDLTLRSADSFGSFHLLKMLFDDYIFHLVEQRLAKAAGTPVACLLSKNWIGNAHFAHTMELDDPALGMVTQMVPASNNIQYVVTSSDPKYVFTNSNEIIVTSTANGSYMMVPGNDQNWNHQMIPTNSQQLEAIVYVDENGHQTTPDPSQTQYIVMTAPAPTTQAELHQQIRQETNEAIPRQNSFDNVKQARTADDLVLSGDILEADIDSTCDDEEEK